MFMMLSFCFTRLHCERGATKTPRLLCSVYVNVFMGGMRLNGVANSVIRLREKYDVCFSVELQQIECTLMDDVTISM